MPKRKKNMTSDEPVMFQKRLQNAQPQNEILCSKGIGDTPTSSVWKPGGYPKALLASLF